MSHVLRPISDRLVLRMNSPETITAGGIVLPDTAQRNPNEGVVLAVGPGHCSEQTGERLPVGIDVGDVVVVGRYGGTEVTIEGEEYLLISARDVLAKRTRTLDELDELADDSLASFGRAKEQQLLDAMRSDDAG